MAHVLTEEQVEQVVNNTLLVLLARPDRIPEWHETLVDLLGQSEQAQLDEEALFVAAVLALLHSPDDILPTGTAYDHAWQMLLSSLRTGRLRAARPEFEQLSLKQMLRSIADAVVTVLIETHDYKEAVINELQEIRHASEQAGEAELTRWLNDVLLLAGGTPPDELGQCHSELYAEAWNAIIRRVYGNRT